MRTLTCSLLALLALPALAAGPSKVVILGDSLTEGYGVAREESYPSVLEKLLKEKGRGRVAIVNAGIGGSTTASAVPRLKWHLKAKPDILVVALGGNDGLRGVKLEETRKNLREVIELAKKSGIRVLLAGMKIPPSYGPEYARGFEKLFADLAREEKVPLIPFLLEGVGGDPAMNQADGIHPNAKGHERIARTVLKSLEPML